MTSLALWAVVGASLPLAVGFAAPNPQDLQLAAMLQQSYSRSRSTVCCRTVTQPTRARLDVATHDRNNLLHVPNPERPTPPAKPVTLSSLTFADSLVAASLVDRLKDTPLTESEKQHPLSVEPLLDYLANWNFEACEKLMVAAAMVTAEKWGNDQLARPLQKLALLYLHEAPAGVELWGKLEFEPTVRFLQGVTDEDGDGYFEAYGRLNPDAANPALLKQVREDYLARVLTPAEVDDYFFELASAWYEKLQTVSLKPEERQPWPNAETEPQIRQALGGRQFSHPTAVLRGKPFGKALYNVFLVSWETAGSGEGPQPGEATGGEANGPAAPLVSLPAEDNLTRWQRELQEWGAGNWENWVKRLAPFRADVQRQLAERPKAYAGLLGRDGFLFFRGSLEYLLAGDLRQQPDDRDPYPAVVDYNEQLHAKGIDLLLVVIPAKPEVFPDKVSASAPRGGRPYVTPYTRKLLMELAGAGVESVDLLPAFLDARDQSPEPFYMPLDTHWSNTAIQVAAKLIAERVKQYPWFAQACPRPLKYRTQLATSTRTGDVRGMLTDTEKLQFPPMKLTARQVLTPDGALYEDSPDSPILVLGDSFCGVYHFEDCKHAGLSAHLAKELGMPVDLIMAHGSGPMIRGQVARRGADYVAGKKLFIWTVVARDLYRYRAPWKSIPVP